MLFKRVVSTYGVGRDSGLFADDVEHTVLESLLVFGKTVLLPGIVKDAAIEVVAGHASLEEGEASAVVGLLLEFKLSAVLHVLTELAWVSTAELLKGSLNLLLLDVVVLLILGAAWKSLPGELTLQEVEKNVTNSLQVISSRLLDSLMSGNRGISGGSSQILAIFVGNMLALRVLVALGETKIDDVDVVTR